MIDCKETLARFYEYLDQELSKVRAEEVTNHLEACRECFDRMEFERAFGTFVQNECRDKVDADALKSKILARIGQLECAHESEDLFPPDEASHSDDPPAKRGIPLWSYLLAAAAVVLVAIPFFKPEDRVPLADPVVMSFVSQHIDSRPQMVSDDPVALADWVGQKVSFDPMIQKFVDAGCEVKGAAVDAAWTHLFLQDDDVEVSVFIGEKDNFEMPAGMESVTINGHTFWTKEVNSYSVVVWESDCDGVICAAVAMAGMDRVVHLAHRVSDLDLEA